MNRKQKLIYMAGIVDGEGCFNRPSCKNGRGDQYYESRLNVSNNNTELIDWIKENFGGYARLEDRTVRHPNWKHTWRWNIGGKKAEALALELLPYLIVKKEQVKRVIRPYKT